MPDGTDKKMTLDIVVPRYKEPWETGKYLFDTIATQRGIEFENIKVILVNDGREDLLDVSHFSDYPYQIVYLVKDHGGVSAARNYGLDNSDADIVMFCDFDDGFLSNYGIHLIFSAYNEGFDVLNSCFVEETMDDNAGVMRIIRHDKDLTFIHGKAYRRQFLVDNDLRFDPELTIHEDGYFNHICFVVGEENVKSIGTPFYLWRWNDNSTVRADRENFVMRSYEMLMKVRDATCTQLEKRGYIEAYYTAVAKTVLDSYYDFQKPDWRKDKYAKQIRIAERAFRGFWMKYKKSFLECNARNLAEIALASRTLAYKNGLLIEEQDIKTWLKHIEHEVK